MPDKIEIRYTQVSIVTRLIRLFSTSTGDRRTAGLNFELYILD